MSADFPCIYFEPDGKCRKFSSDVDFSYCVLGPCPEQKLSYADRIRSMSNEELSKFLCEFRSCDSDGYPCSDARQRATADQDTPEWRTGSSSQRRRIPDGR